MLLLLAENSWQPGACPCEALAWVLRMTALVSRAWALADGLLVKRPANVRFAVLLGPDSNTATRTPVPSKPSVWARSVCATDTDVPRSRTSLRSSSNRTPIESSRARSRNAATVIVAWMHGTSSAASIVIFAFAFESASVIRATRLRSSASALRWASGTLSTSPFDGFSYSNIEASITGHTTTSIHSRELSCSMWRNRVSWRFPYFS